jgi:integrase
MEEPVGAGSSDVNSLTRTCTKTRAGHPEHVPEFVLALNTGLRLSEQYGLPWTDVSFARRVLTIQRSKNGSMRHVPLIQAALRALQRLREHAGSTGFVCGGVPGPRRHYRH